MVPTASRMRSTLEKIVTQLASLAEIAKDEELLELRAPSVSSWSVGEQVEHLRRSDLTIIKALESVPEDGPKEGSPSLAGRAVLLLGFIPRGAGKAPQATQPLEVDCAALPGQIEGVSRAFGELEPAFERLGSTSATIRHPALGHFSPAQMLDFARIHHHHHMKLVRDIRRAADTKH